MKIVLFGKDGQLGWEFQRILPVLGEVTALGRRDADVSDLNTIEKILGELNPDLIINASAYTEVDKAETQVDLAITVNATAPGVMAEMARKLNAVFIHYSTDYVFDGNNTIPYKETDPANPLSVYGQSKLNGEQNVQQAGDAYLILRTSWVYSLRGNSFVNKVLGWARKNETLKIVSDQISSPTWARMLAEITSLVIAPSKAVLFDSIRERRGLYHLAGSGYTSRYEWAKQILANDQNLEEQLTHTLEPGLTSDFPTPATRPLFSALDCARFRENFGLQMPDWNTMLNLAMAE
ncbi:MAG TPA: dTDP-4-dehydrorhamnose reductase [Anaerolineales bacterium]|nr:dTDP-4-dehydrorhamnose reductase [Anaerolineales bacterium]